MSDFVSQVSVTLTKQLSALASWMDEALIDLQGFSLFLATRVSAAWQLFLDDLSVLTNLFASWVNSRIDEYPSIKSLNDLHTFDVLIAASSLALTAVLIALSIRAKTKRNHDDQRDELTLVERPLIDADIGELTIAAILKLERESDEGLLR